MQRPPSLSRPIALDSTDTTIHPENDPQDEAPKPPAGLEQRLRAGSDSFAFDTLLAGVSTMNGTASESVYDAPRRAPEHPPEGIIPISSNGPPVMRESGAKLAARDGRELVPHADHTVQIRPFAALALVVLIALATSVSATMVYLRLTGHKTPFHDQLRREAQGAVAAGRIERRAERRRGQRP